MKTIYKTREEIEDVIACVKEGGVVAFPTDTVYGLGVMYGNLDALNRLKLSKGRPESKPIPMMISSVAQLEQVAYVSPQAHKLIQAFMPGAFTIILKKKASVEDEYTNGFDTIACRMPEDDFILKMIDALGRPMLVTSANLSGQPTGTTTDEVIQSFDGRIDMIVSGECKGLLSSTIVSAVDEVKIVREGPIAEEEIRKVLEG